MEDMLVRLTSSLIQMENTTPERINYSVEFCADWLQRHGVPVRLWENQGLKMITATIGQVNAGSTLVLNGHLDVVPGHPENFIPRVEGGRLYGRGSYDMLGSVAAMMNLAADLVHQPPNCRIILQLVPDEEKGGELGSCFLVEQGSIGDFVICGEPTNLDIAVQAKGVLQVRVEFSGVAAHGSRPWLGKNAIVAAMQKYNELATLDFMQESSRFFPVPSFNLAKIEGGAALNQVPDRCSLYLDIRYLPTQNPADILESIRQAVPDAHVETLRHGSPVTTSEFDPYVQSLYQSTAHVFGKKTALFGQDGSADTRFFAQYGIPAVEFGPIGANHHGPDEYVEIESLVYYQKILKHFIKQLEGKVSTDEIEK
ncbi:M20 family metallopeptidase [Brevibacillus centrosporus]|uniref:M20 family metallopeptidase n=1 Tax=Brevibacillus centrosporus TaxID=54910 RepID=UPI000F0A241F|nr:M20/M25/M40 family metallo-hydrolase [Brevibacillus centrosporus]MEC2133156.1 M20/M25/M40 family metallo-hydrolase [Brevibacillus centrosporus]RNB64906.1 M20 family peptidase [Brevibacillus centrosporus]GED31245.1 peptidase M20 [Brevibacillus centrosporus]